MTGGQQCEGATTCEHENGQGEPESVVLKQGMYDKVRRKAGGGAWHMAREAVAPMLVRANRRMSRFIKNDAQQIPAPPYICWYW